MLAAGPRILPKFLACAQIDSEAAAPKTAVYAVRCGGPCVFSVQSPDKAEVIAIVKQHAKAHHHMNASDKDIEGMIKTKQVVVK